MSVLAVDSLMRVHQACAVGAHSFDTGFDRLPVHSIRIKLGVELDVRVASYMVPAVAIYDERTMSLATAWRVLVNHD